MFQLASCARLNLELGPGEVWGVGVIPGNLRILLTGCLHLQNLGREAKFSFLSTRKTPSEPLNSYDLRSYLSASEETLKFRGREGC